jgi:6-pyruvoyltetrahydropterin/6-carboxytetrahydropterin synthase
LRPTVAPVVYVSRVYRFNAGHRLYDPRRSAAWNEAVFGKCSYEGGHGHNYRLEVCVRGVPSPETGWVVPPARLDRWVEELVLDPLDHRSLNQVLSLEVGTAPTTEVLAVEIWQRLAPVIPAPARLWRLVIAETEKNVFEYRGGGEVGAYTESQRAR